MTKNLLILLSLVIALSGCAKVAYNSLHQREAHKNHQDGMIDTPAHQPAPPSYEEYVEQRKAHIEKVKTDETNPKTVDQ